VWRALRSRYAGRHRPEPRDLHVRAARHLLAPGRALAGIVERLGRGTLGWCRTVSYLVAVVTSALALACRRAHWSSAVWDVFARQLLFTGVDAIWLSVRVAVAVGIMVVVQAELWLATFGQMELIGQLLLTVLVRELAPLLANLVVIVRSGTAITTELATMRLAGEIDVLDAQGLDPMTYLVMPRVLSMPIAVFGLTAVFTVVSFASGYLVGAAMGSIVGGPGLFFSGILEAVSWEDAMFFFPKTIVSGLFVAAICATEGLSVGAAVTEVPQAAGRATTRSLSAVLVVSAVLSLIIYGRFLVIKVL